jgi:single-stranded-DNA-specific exonuclease
MENKKWDIVHKAQDAVYSVEDIVAVLLQNRNITTKEQIEEFFHSTHPKDITLESLEIDEAQVKKAIKRLERAKESQEKVIVFGDYDADGVCATAILWEALYERGIDALPYIPDRFSEGYGLKPQAIADLKGKYPNLGLIITVDNGIVAFDGVTGAKKLNIDVIVTDHHQASEDMNAYAVIHTTRMSGSGISWILTREISKHIVKTRNAIDLDISLTEALALAAIGTISDQLPLIGVNRSIVKYGLAALRNTSNKGLQALAMQANLECSDLGVYEVGFVIAPRINAAGRLAHAIDSLRLVCTKDGEKAQALAKQISQTNVERQSLVEHMIIQAEILASKDDMKGFLVVASEHFHEGIIGLAASKIVEKFNRPTIVIAKGETMSKASARSLPGIDIIAEIRKLDSLLVEAGGHQMAAGFSIDNKNLEKFLTKLEKNTKDLLTESVLTKTVRIDMELPFSALTWDVAEKLIDFEPVGTGNTPAVFATLGVEVKEAKTVGSDGKHLKLKVTDGEGTLDAIAFGFGSVLPEIKKQPVNIAYNLEVNHYNGSSSLQLKVKDIQLLHEPK